MRDIEKSAWFHMLGVGEGEEMKRAFLKLAVEDF